MVLYYIIFLSCYVIPYCNVLYYIIRYGVVLFSFVYVLCDLFSPWRVKNSYRGLAERVQNG